MFHQRRLEKKPVEALPPDHVTIYSCSDEECETLEVPLQREFKGSRQVLQSSVASTPCSELSLQDFLNLLNSHLGTSYDLIPERRSLLQHSLRYAHDFGVAYSILRPRWSVPPLDAIKDIEECSEDDSLVRGPQAFQDENDMILYKYMRPRRVWDLWSNRVVPIWMAIPGKWVSGQHRKEVTEAGDGRGYFAVSHAWLDENKRQGVSTPINSYAWPVPIPSDTTLERIRTELLHHTSMDRQCVWLDVLCLRQQGKEEDEPTRKEEWKLDIPTIGASYEAVDDVVYYYSGLGRPFQIGDLASRRHWLNRAWTLQERKPDAQSFVAGICPRSPSVFDPHADDSSIEDSARLFIARMDQSRDGAPESHHLLGAIKELRCRYSTSELDKIAGLNYIREFTQMAFLPAYVLNEDPEDMWWRFLHGTSSKDTSQLFFDFPEPGVGTDKHPAWCPSWQQLANLSALLPSSGNDKVHVSEWKSREALFYGTHINDCSVEGFGGSGRRQGKVTIRNRRGEEMYFRAAATHDQPILDGVYTLLTEVKPLGQPVEELEGPRATHIRCVLGRMAQPKKFKKITVIDIEKDNQLWPQVPGNNLRVLLL